MKLIYFSHNDTFYLGKNINLSDWETHIHKKVQRKLQYKTG